MTFFEIAILIIAGLLVGFINTLAGGATIISLTALMFLGLPINVANGTHRIAALFQTLTSVITFRSRHVLDWKKGFLYGIPIVLGSVPGALLAVEVNEVIFEKIVAVLMIFMALFLFYKPRRWITGKADQLDRPFTLKQGFIFFILGLYGGFIYVGMGYFLLATIVLSAGYDVVRANAIKALVVLMYVPFTIGVFLWGNMIRWQYGLVLAIGQMTGAFIGAHSAVKGGAGFVRWVIIVFIVLNVTHLLGWISIDSLLLFLQKTQGE